MKAIGQTIVESSLIFQYSIFNHQRSPRNACDGMGRIACVRPSPRSRPELLFQRCSVRARIPTDSQAGPIRAPARWAASTSAASLRRSSTQIILPPPCGRSPILCFANTNSAAASASAFSLRLRSRSSSLILRLSSRVCCGLARASSGCASAVVALSRHCCRSLGKIPCSRHYALRSASSIAAVAITASITPPSKSRSLARAIGALKPGNLPARKRKRKTRRLRLRQ